MELVGSVLNSLKKKLDNIESSLLQMHSNIGGDVFISLYNKTLFLISNKLDHKMLSTEPCLFRCYHKDRIN